MLDDGKPVTVCAYGFNVPCRHFLITANITRDRRMPVVDEFVLRVLKTCERIPVKRLGAYFGFSEVDTETVMTDLVARSLVVIEDDMALLHASAHEHFRSADDGIPRIMDIETWVERLWFDLVSRNIMAPERVRPTRNLIDIQPDATARDLPATFARKAFEENFSDYLRTVRRINNPDHFGLYSISDVRPGRFGYVVLKGREDLVFDPDPRVVPHLLEVDVDSLARFYPLSNAIGDAYRRLTKSEASAAALADFARLTSDRTIAAAIGEDGFFDLRTWFASEQTRADLDRQPIFGASYMTRNVDVFLRALEKRSLPDLANQPPREINLFWFRPTGVGWGATPDLQDVLLNLRALVRRSLPAGWRLRTSLVTPLVSKRESSRRFERVFDQGYTAPPGRISPAVELLLLPGVGAMVLVRVVLSSAASVTVGFSIVDSKSIERIEAHLRLDIFETTSPVWARPRAEEDEEQSTQETIANTES